MQASTTSKRVITIAESLPVLFNLHEPFSLPRQIKKIEFIAKKISGGDEPLLQLNSITILHQFYRRYALCALEGILLPNALPNTALQCLLEQTEMDTQNKKLLITWIEILNSHQNELGPWLLHQALFQFTSQILSQKPIQEVLQALLH